MTVQPTEKNKKNTAGKASSGSGTRPRTRNSASGSTAQKNTQKTRLERVNEEEMARKRRVLLAKEIAFVVILGIAVLIFVSNFTDSLAFIHRISYQAFGILSYVWPFVIVVFAWLLLFTEMNGHLLTRLFSVLLFMFALSGMFSLAMENPDGGLLGKANTALFYSWLNRIGTYIVDAVILLVAVILFTGFSLSQAAKNISGRTEEEKALRSREAELEREKKELLRKEAARKREAKERAKIDRLEQENDAIRDRANQKLDQAEKIRDRFQPVYGIGDTTIRDTGAPVNTSFGTQEDALKKNEKLFSSYSNSGKIAPETRREPDQKKESFIPDIKIPSEFFDSKPDEAVKPAEKPVSKPEPVKEPEEEFIPYKLDKDDEYVKTVITSTGKIITTETEGNILAHKEIIEGNPVSTFKPVYGDDEEDFDENDDLTPAEAEENHPASSGAVSHSGGKSALSAEKASNAPTEKDQEEIVKEIREEPKKEYRFPPIKLLKRGTGGGMSKSELEKELKDTAAKLQETLRIFGVGCTITNITCGPSVTRYEIQPDVGVKVSRIVSLTDDIKLNLAAADIRMEAPIPGKSAIGIEIPNKVKKGVVLRDLLETEEFQNAKSQLSFAAGRDIEGNTIVANIEKMPHVLVAGATGSGKSVCINTMIMSILYHAKPTDVKMILVDPKVVELSVYNGIPHLLLPVVTDPKKAAAALNWAVAEMEDRYQKFAEFGVRGIEGFNQMIERDQPTGSDGYPVKRMPKILIIVDELADLMMVASKDVETAICRLAQKARAAGIHLVLATQRPSVDVITGLIKANIPSRIAFAVSSGTDSRTILDMVGAENLLGMGDMLYAPAGSNKPIRVQGAFVSDDEIHDVVEFLANEGEVKGSGTAANVDLSSPSGTSASAGSGGDDRDEYFEAAGRLIVDKQKCSIGMLQRQFKIGFNRAARIVDQLSEAGVVGEEEGTKPRNVLMNMAEFEKYLKG